MQHNKTYASAQLKPCHALARVACPCYVASHIVPRLPSVLMINSAQLKCTVCGCCFGIFVCARECLSMHLGMCMWREGLEYNVFSVWVCLSRIDHKCFDRMVCERPSYISTQQSYVLKTSVREAEFLPQWNQGVAWKSIQVLMSETSPKQLPSYLRLLNLVFDYCMH